MYFVVQGAIDGLALRVGDITPEIYRWDNETYELMPLGRSFVSALLGVTEVQPDA